MRTKDLICKAEWDHVQGIRDVVINNLVEAKKRGTFQCDEKNLPVLLTLITSSIEEGYHKGVSTFERTIDHTLQENLKQPTQECVKKK